MILFSRKTGQRWSVNPDTGRVSVLSDRTPEPITKPARKPLALRPGAKMRGLFDV